MSEDTYAAALRRERAGYAARGEDDRVAQVDAELQRIGAEAAPEPQPDPSTDPDPVKSAPRGRGTREQKQATG